MATAERPQASPVGAPSPEPAGPARYKFSVDDYYRMAEAGILRRGQRVELIDGDVIAMSPIGSRHAACVDLLTRFFQRALWDRALIRTQGPLRLGEAAEPEPDILVLEPRPDSYRSAHPGPSNVRLLIEVMDTSAGYDRGVKLGLYARSGVPEVWLVDVNGEVVEIYAGPEGDAYSERRTASRGQHLAPRAFPDATLAVDEIFD
jgi:Uma2 family endonuclease